MGKQGKHGKPWSPHEFHAFSHASHTRELHAWQKLLQSNRPADNLNSLRKMTEEITEKLNTEV